MEIDTPSPSGSAAPTATTLVTPASVNVTLHVLVMLNISEHYTRISANKPSSATGPSVVLGALLGTQDGQEITLHTSFAIPLGADEIIDEDYLQTKSEQFKEVLPDYDVQGWYIATVGNQVTDAHMRLHRQFLKQNDNPLLLVLDASPVMEGESVPMQVYESVVDVTHQSEEGEPKLFFSSVPYIMATSDSESIAVDHVATKIGKVDEARSAAADSLLQPVSSLRMLHTRLSSIHQYLKQVQQGKVKYNHDIIRNVHSLTAASGSHSGLASNTHETDTALLNDVLLTSYLATVTKACGSLEKMSAKLQYVSNKRNN